VNYEARDFGVKRGMRGEDAKKLCADFHIFYVNQKRGKADLTKYREASAKIFEILLKHCVNVEKASIDEAYLDVTELVLNRIRNEISLPDNLKDSLKDSYLGDSKNRDEFDKWLENCTNLREETSDALLFVGALIAEEIRQDIYDTLGFKCSAGVAHNKV
jgi:DNA polymerase eta